MKKESITRKNSWKGLVAGAIAATTLCGAAHAGLLVDFKPDPISPNNPEIVLQQSGALRELVASPTASGSTGTGDGAAAAGGAQGAQVPGGLFIQTPVAIPLIGGAPVADYGGVVNGTSTTFYDVTLILHNLKTSAPVQNTVLVPDPDGAGPLTGINLLSQEFKGPNVDNVASFELWSTPSAAHAGAKALLLQGNIDLLFLVGLQGEDSSSIQSTSLTYTAGEILSKWVAQGGGTEGSLSWSLLPVVPDLASDSGLLSNFQADMTGLFSANTVPEPASMALMALAGVGLLGRFRRRKA